VSVVRLERQSDDLCLVGLGRPGDDHIRNLDLSVYPVVLRCPSPRPRGSSSAQVTAVPWGLDDLLTKALTAGSFMIYGKKNYLPPMPLEMGFGVLFR